MYACPRCHRVVSGIYRVEYGVELELYEDERCASCLQGLYDESAIVRYSSTLDLAWGIAILARVGNPDAVTKPNYRRIFDSATAATAA